MSWTAELSSSAIRDLDRLPPRVLPAVIEFIYGPLVTAPRVVGKPLRGDFEGEWGARRGAYRVLYRLSEEWGKVVVTRIGHRGDVYRPR